MIDLARRRVMKKAPVGTSATIVSPVAGRDVGDAQAGGKQGIGKRHFGPTGNARSEPFREAIRLIRNGGRKAPSLPGRFRNAAACRQQVKPAGPL